MKRPVMNLYRNAHESIVPHIQHLLDDLNLVKTSPNTRLCNIMDQNGSNKNHRQHVIYTPFYDAWFGGLNPAYVMEFGIGSKNSGMPYNMNGQETVVGGSIRGWKEAFPMAEIFGADIDIDSLFKEDRIRTMHVDVTERSSVDNMWNEIRFEIGNARRFQLIVDDAYHKFDANRTLFEGSIDMLDSHGYYVIEDIEQTDDNLATFDQWLNAVGYDGLLLEIPNPTNGTCCCFAVIRKD